MAEFKDQFTLDGLLKPAHPSVTRAKVAEADRLLQKALRGDKIATGQLAEVHTTSDLKFNLAHLITTVALPQFDEAERTWSQVAGVRTVPDFGPVRLQSIFGSLTGAGVAQGPANGQGISGGLPVVPEAAPYPYLTVTGQEAFYSKLSKLGAKFGFTWEASVNDVVGFFEQIPGELVQLALDTEEREVYEALINGTTVELASQTLPDGTVTDPNAAISPEAIWAAILQLQNTVVNGRKVGRASGYNVVVPAGTADFINWRLNQQIIEIQDGSIVYGPGDRSVFNNVTIVESVYLTGTNWIILPKPGAIRRPVLELLRLRGYERPELRVHGDTGQYVGGSAVSPFEGSWDNDTVDYRIRYVAGGVLWADDYSIKSDGSGEA
jgi:hypothetical protein